MNYSERAKHIFEGEIDELTRLSRTIDHNFDKVIDLIYNCQGKLVVTGIGKTGIIGHKIASSLASTGTPAIFVNAAEAVHGDLGMISSKDVVLLVSNSGATNEILNVIAPLRRLGCTLIAMTRSRSVPPGSGTDYLHDRYPFNGRCPDGLPHGETTLQG